MNKENQSFYNVKNVDKIPNSKRKRVRQNQV